MELMHKFDAFPIFYTGETTPRVWFNDLDINTVWYSLIFLVIWTGHMVYE